MKLDILNEHFEVVDTKEKITIADSFVLPQNKIGAGNGEAKLYIGQENSDTRNLFGGPGFRLPCFLLKKDLLQYLEDTKVEYLNPEQPYKNKEGLPKLWLDRKSEVELLDDKIEFEVAEQSQIEGPRIYVNSSDPAYKLIRKLSLPNITYISVVKLSDDAGKLQYYFRLFADYFGEAKHPFSIKKEQEERDDGSTSRSGVGQSRYRVGQSKYRKNLLDQCPRCPITLISDERILRASHIKPWARSNDFEKTDPYNGFMLTPTFDVLFDQGFMSFTDDKKTILSPFLSNMTYSKLNISDNKTFSHLPVEGREEYLAFHRSDILKR